MALIHLGGDRSRDAAPVLGLALLDDPDAAVDALPPVAPDEDVARAALVVVAAAIDAPIEALADDAQNSSVYAAARDAGHVNIAEPELSSYA